MSRKKEYIESEVLDKAMHIFWKNGYEGTSIRSLEKGMGINQFSIYANFKSKNGLLLASLKHYQQKVYDDLLATLEKSDGGIVEIKRFFYHFVDFVKVNNRANGCLLTNTMLELGQKDKKVEANISIFVNQVREVFTVALFKSIESGDLKDATSIPVYVNYLMSILQGLAASTKFFNRKQLGDYIETAFKNLD